MESRKREGGDQKLCIASGAQVTLGISLILFENLELAI